MHIALTGASGFIGSYTCRAAAEAGHTLTALVRESSRREHIQPFIARFVNADHADDSAWPQLLDGTDAVIHNSADWRSIFVANDNRSFDAHLQSNLVGSIRLLRASAPRPFVFVSTIAVHHDMRPRWKGLIDEDHPLRPASNYGAYKAAVEAHLWADHYSTGRHTVAVRPCGVYGLDPKLDRSHGYSIIERLAANQPFDKLGGGKFVHVEDVAAAAIASAAIPGAGGHPFNLVDCYARWADWAALAADVLGVRAKIDFSSPAQPKNEFTKDAARDILRIPLDRGHEGIRQSLHALAAEMRRQGKLS